MRRLPQEAALIFRPNDMDPKKKKSRRSKKNIKQAEAALIFRPATSSTNQTA